VQLFAPKKLLLKILGPSPATFTAEISLSSFSLPFSFSPTLTLQLVMRTEL
jgi:hypothetical protein